MDRLMAMQVYRTVVSSGSFSSAAKLLRLSAASVSRYVADLERHLGAVLLRRSSRSLLVTDTGEAYYEQCCAILDRITEIEESAGRTRSDLRGRLRVSMPSSFGTRYLAPLLPAFMERYPDIELEAWCSDDLVDFSESRVDVAILLAREIDDNLIAKKLAAVRHVAVAAPAYLDLYGRPQSPDDLQAHACLSYVHASQGDTWRFLKGGVEVGVQVKCAFRSNGGDVVRAACIEGRGIAIVPAFLAEDDLHSGVLVEVLTDYRPVEYGCFAVYPVDSRNCARVGAFVDFLTAAELPPSVAGS